MCLEKENILKKKREKKTDGIAFGTCCELCRHIRTRVPAHIIIETQEKQNI